MILWDEFERRFRPVISGPGPTEDVVNVFWNPDTQRAAVILAAAQNRLWTVYSHASGAEIVTPGMRGIGTALLITSVPYEDLSTVVLLSEVSFQPEQCTVADCGGWAEVSSSKVSAEDDTIMSVLYACERCGKAEVRHYDTINLEWV